MRARGRAWRASALFSWAAWLHGVSGRVGGEGSGDLRGIGDGAMNSDSIEVGFGRNLLARDDSEILVVERGSDLVGEVWAGENRTWAVEGTGVCGAGSYFKVQVSEEDSWGNVVVMLRSGEVPSVSVPPDLEPGRQGVEQWQVEADHVDWVSYRLGEARHLVYGAVGQGAGGGATHYVTVFHPPGGGGGRQKVKLWGSCESNATRVARDGHAVEWGGRPCPLECSGHGVCGAENSMLGPEKGHLRNGTCLCDENWAGRGCDVPLEDPIAIESWQRHEQAYEWGKDVTVGAGGRTVFPLLIPGHAEGANVLVHMERHSGDPVLLVTRAYAEYASARGLGDDDRELGFETSHYGGESLTVPRGDPREALNRVPSVLDVGRFGDAEALHMSESSQYVYSRSISPGLYYVAILNSQTEEKRSADGGEESSVSLSVRVAASEVCPGQCSGRGKCSKGACVCWDGFAGRDCKERVQALVAHITTPRVLPAGEWTYLAFYPREHVSAWGLFRITGAVVKVQHCGGDLRVLVRTGSPGTPSAYDTMYTVENANATWACGEGMGNVHGQLEFDLPIPNPRYLSFVSVHNNAYSGHGDAKLIVEATPVFEHDMAVIGIVTAIFALMVVLFCTCVIGRSHAFTLRFRETRASARQARRMSRDRREAKADVGIPAEVLATLPTLTYPEDAFTEEGGHCDCCAVCLEDYIDGDELLRMPNCSHVFHAACLEDWLTDNSTCPCCRANFHGHAHGDDHAPAH